MFVFADAEVAASRSHTIDGHSVNVQVYIPPKPRPMYDDRCFVSGASENTTKDSIELFLESKAGLEVRNSEKGEEPGTFVVIFDEAIGDKKQFSFMI